MFLLILSVKSYAGHPQNKEFRGVWIATVNNIDWPSAPGLPVEVQKQELKELIERIEHLNLNVVILQVRAASDAFYPSETEPWSRFLTGKQGLAPSPSFDPLSYAIELCHAKGMELHAWFNPFRVRNIGHYLLDPKNFAAINPQYVHEYDNKLFFDPGIPQVRNHIIKVIMEVVRKYNIDAIHLDDYFYPYPIRGKKFPDQKTFRQYGGKFYPGKLGDWRRENLNQFIGTLHDSIKSVKPFLRLGISPFGVWRNKSDDSDGSPGIKATTSYDDLYANVYLWLGSNWIDYVIPQLYWEQGNRFGDFAGLTKWWDEHCFGKPLYIGQALYKSTGEGKVFTNPMEISEQISILRKFEHVGGFALYSAKHLARLSETALNELSANLSPILAETKENMAPIPNDPQITPIQKAEPPRERILMAENKSISDTINLVYQSVIHKELTIPEQFSVIRFQTGRKLFWKTPPGIGNTELKFSVIIFEPVKGGGYLRRVIQTTDNKQIFIPRKSGFNSARVLFAIVSVNSNGEQSPFSKLFRIRGKRIIYN